MVHVTDYLLHSPGCGSEWPVTSLSLFPLRYPLTGALSLYRATSSSVPSVMSKRIPQLTARAQQSGLPFAFARARLAPTITANNKAGPSAASTTATASTAPNQQPPSNIVVPPQPAPLSRTISTTSVASNASAVSMTTSSVASQAPARALSRSDTLESSSPSAIEISDDDDDNIVCLSKSSVVSGRKRKRARRSRVESGDEESPEQQLERISKDWMSPVYGFFSPTVLILEIDGRRALKFKCEGKGCGSTILRYLDTGDAASTGNLRRHIKGCKPSGGVEALNAASAFAQSGKGKVVYSARQHTRTGLRAEVVRWLSESFRPYETVRDRGFLCLMKTGRPELWVPSPKTAGRDMINAHIEARNRVARLLISYEGRVSFSSDTWISPNHRSYMAILAHIEHEGQPLVLPLDLAEVPFSHTGAALSEVMQRTAVDFGIATKVLAFTGDNATNNDTLCTEWHKRNLEFLGEESRIRCILHTESLAARIIIKQFDILPGSSAIDMDDTEKVLRELAEGLEAPPVTARSDDTDEDESDSNSEDELADDDEGSFDERATMSAGERRQHEVDVRPMKMVLVKLRKIAYAILNSPTKHGPAWRKILSDLKLPERMMPRDVSTRWNSTFEMLKFAVEYRDALEVLTMDRELRKYELEPQEWDMAEQLCNILHVFYDATQYFSSAAPNLAQVIPAMDLIDEHINDNILKPDIHPAIRIALNMAKRLLNRYYSRTDVAPAYRIAMVLHPRHKLGYFVDWNWEPEWIENARRSVYNEFTTRYLKYGTGVGVTEVAASGGGNTSIVGTTKNMFINMPALAKINDTAVMNELDHYLKQPREDAGENALKWWYNHRTMYPCLSRMARDYLSIPATSVDAERVFSKGRILHPHTRNRLSAKSTRALLIVHFWSKLGLVRDADFERAAKVTDVMDEPADTRSRPAVMLTGAGTVDLSQFD
ncbi:hypothetical protein EUX98_g9192 [Antrodiella citrinella]|uniref:HAT C-terminal dimerisation domain-containing protein n=1 Tax=Antrodiella citrinella TaxID=2447956 RepID=A0A4V3XFD9_9APHY|nr:hypothetical protein EUX98_g9192 [Antrodiella citrinella]